MKEQWLCVSQCCYIVFTWGNSNITAPIFLKNTKNILYLSTLRSRLSISRRVVWNCGELTPHLNLFTEIVFHSGASGKQKIIHPNQPIIICIYQRLSSSQRHRLSIYTTHSWFHPRYDTGVVNAKHRTPECPSLAISWHIHHPRSRLAAGRSRNKKSPPP